MFIIIIISSSVVTFCTSNDNMMPPIAHRISHATQKPGSLSWTTWVSRYQKGKTNLDFTEARDSEWQWQQLGRMQVCTSLQTDNHTSTPPLSFYRPDALPAAKPTASTHSWRKKNKKHMEKLRHHHLTKDYRYHTVTEKQHHCQWQHYQKTYKTICLVFY